MYDYIKKIYLREMESNRLLFNQSDHYRFLETKLEQYHDEISTAMGKPFFIGFSDTCTQKSDADFLACFRQGFHVAVRLMLDER